MNLGDRVRSGVKWLLVGSIGNQLLSFAFGIVLARLLVPAEFGMVVTLGILTGFVGMFASAGMGQSLIRSKDVTPEDFEAVFTMQLWIGILIYLGFFVCAPRVAIFFKDPLYADLLRVSALSFIIRPFSQIRLSWLNREMEFKKRSIIDACLGVLGGLLSIAMAAAGMGVWSLTLTGLIGGLGSAILLSRVTPLRLRLRFRFDIARKHTAYGFKITVSDFLAYLIEQVANLVLSKLGGPGVVGLFNKAESLARMPNRLLTPPVGQTVLRAMSTVQDNLDQTKYLYYRAVALLMVYIFPLLVGLWWVADPLIGLLYGERWLPCVAPLQIMILIGFVRPITTPSWNLLAAQNRLVPHLIGQAMGLVFLIAACLIGLHWGLEGVAWGTVVTQVYFATYTYILVYRTISTRVADLFFAAAPALILNTLLFAILALAHALLVNAKMQLPWLYLIAMIVTGSLTYVLAFLFLPIPALRSEALRWRRRIASGFRYVRKPPE